MIDSHCHLADAKFTQDLPEVVSRAQKAGVDRMIAIADSLTEASVCRTIAEKYDPMNHALASGFRAAQIFYTAGVHPHNAIEWKMDSGKWITEHAGHSKCRAVGEIGLDYHYMNSPKEDQIRVFREQVEIANELNFPIVVHNRESIEDLKIVIAEHKPAKMVLHCCTEKWKDVEDLVERGYLLSFTGIATYPKSQEIRETIKRCPLTQMMVETDAPYLAPEGKRGQRNEPAFVVEVAKLIAEIKGISYEEVDRVTTENAVEFFQLCL